MSDFFNDMPEEAEFGPEAEQLVEDQVAAVEAGEYVEEDAGEYSQVLTDILTESEVEVLSDAQMRLDQARLYEMLIKHNLFAGIHANKRAIQIVQDEAKNFFLERMEILLGMKSPTQPVQHVESPFNDLEVQALKDIAAKLTKGASQNDAEPQIRPVQPPKQNGLRPLNQNKLTQQNQSPRPVQQKQPVRKPAPQQTQENERQGLTKKPKDMTPAELIELNKQIPRQKRAVSSRYIPPMDADAKEMLYSRNAMSSNSEGSVIMNLLARSGKINVNGIESVDSGNDDGDVNGRI
jgi:hypothetical protein